MSLTKNNLQNLVIGIDPGYDRTGWAVGYFKNNKLLLLDLGCIITDREKTLYRRYQQIHQSLDKIVKDFQPQIAVIESLFFFKNKKTALHVSEARGVILSVFFQNNLEFDEFTPLQIKTAVTGYGRADKKAVEKMLRMQVKFPDNIKEKIIDDAIDAVAVLLTKFVNQA